MKPYIVGDNGLFPEFPLSAVPSVDGSGLSLRIIPESPRVQQIRYEHERSNGSPETLEEIEKDFARVQFLALLLSPDRDWLSEGPCERCGRYYMRKTRGQKKYCGKGCAKGVKNSTAKKLTSRKRGERHDEQLQIAAKLAQQWTVSRTKQDWKHWVCERAEAQRTKLTPKFLTRAVNKGELIEPTKGER
jgi:hypothetical protein